MKPPNVGLASIPPGAPPDLLAWDDAFLDTVERDRKGCLWFWESGRPFVVIGYGQSADREVDLAYCADASIPVLRRCSGGGAVLQGPGCLNYGIALPMDFDPQLSTISHTNRFVMERIRRALVAATSAPVEIQGHTDLAIAGRKFSGNAQRRRKNAVLFHGSFLLGLDLEKMSRALRFPSATPDYRDGRSHSEFVINLGLTPEAVRHAVIAEWNVRESFELPTLAWEGWMARRYRVSSWHERRRDILPDS